MEIIYTHRTKKNTISTNKKLPTKEGDYIYILFGQFQYLAASRYIKSVRLTDRFSDLKST